MCSDGVGRTGAFISTHAEMERMKAETVVVRQGYSHPVSRNGVQQGRTISTSILVIMTMHLCSLPLQDQNKFCHHVLADFLDEFDTYANFKEII